MNKRGGDFDYSSSGGKRARGGPTAKCELRIMVPSKMAGCLIGKGGANIQKLRTEYSCGVRLPDCPGPERLLNISADEWEPTMTCLGAAIPFMYECPNGKDDGGDREIRLLIHQSVVGGIIGKSGSKVKEIRDSSGTQIKVFSTCCPQSTDRVVQVNGTCEKVLVAIKEIIDVVNNSDIKGSEQPYDPINFDSFFASEYGGFGGGSDGSGRRGGGGGGGASRDGPRSSPASRGSRGGLRIGLSSGFGGFGMNEPHFGSGFGGGGPMRGGRGGFDGGMGRGGGRGGFGGGNFGDDDWGVGGGGRGFGGRSSGGGFGGDNLAFNDAPSGGPTETTQVTIPNELAGAIIGPGGQRIRKIRNDSKANITIADPEPNSKDRIITITGDSKAIQTAQYLLQQSVHEHASSGGGY